jgi:Holliday junction resolvase RusA-like endonuclease
MNIVSRKAPRESANQIELFISGEFMQLNDYIRTERGNRFAAADIKESETARAESACDGVPTLSAYPVDITFHWYREDRRTDPDNIAFASKFILDGMVKAGVLKDDGMHEIRSITHLFTVNKACPGVEITVKSVEK